jgi:hypothetical protein
MRHCPTCGNTLWAAYHNYRTITTLTDVVLRIPVETCHRFRLKPAADSGRKLPLIPI